MSYNNADSIFITPMQFYYTNGWFIMKKSVLSTLMVTLLLGAVATLSAQEVFSWRDSRGYNAYSDTPRHLQPAKTRMFNVRTQTVSAPVKTAAQSASGPDSLTDQQAKLSQQIAERNKAIEAKNKKIEANNKKRNEAGCKAARLNRQIAEGARTNNREALLQRYDQDIQQFCN